MDVMAGPTWPPTAAHLLQCPGALPYQAPRQRSLDPAYCLKPPRPHAKHTVPNATTKDTPHTRVMNATRTK
eukprot:XP_001699092.1 predicted protein [Chlamydomonas reinhardtii]